MGLFTAGASVSNRDGAIDLAVPFQEAGDLVGLLARIVVGDDEHFLALDRLSVLLALRLALGVREGKADIASNLLDVRRHR